MKQDNRRGQPAAVENPGWLAGSEASGSVPTSSVAKRKHLLLSSPLSSAVRPGCWVILKGPSNSVICRFSLDEKREEQGIPSSGKRECSAHQRCSPVAAWDHSPIHRLRPVLATLPKPPHFRQQGDMGAPCPEKGPSWTSSLAAAPEVPAA